MSKSPPISVGMAAVFLKVTSTELSLDIIYSFFVICQV